MQCTRLKSKAKSLTDGSVVNKILAVAHFLFSVELVQLETLSSNVLDVGGTNLVHDYLYLAPTGRMCVALYICIH